MFHLMEKWTSQNYLHYFVYILVTKLVYILLCNITGFRPLFFISIFSEHLIVEVHYVITLHYQILSTV